jgi:hypothetical protein
MTWRAARSALVALFLVLLRALPATAAGTGGIEVSPYPGLVDGKQITAFHTKVPGDGSRQVRYSLRNTTTTPRTARLYAASAQRAADGHFTVGDPGSSAYISFDTRTVTLAPKQTEVKAFTVHGPLDHEAYGAIVVEVQNGAITSRAATIVYLEQGSRVPLPLLLAVGAGLLVLAGAAAVVVVRRRG